jgi:hypothetical protein
MRRLIPRIPLVLAICWIFLQTGGGAVVAQPPQPLRNTGESIRLLTFNTYLLSEIFRCKWDPVCHLFESDVEDRAEQIAGRILRANEQFDVVAFNEVWDEDAKNRLVERLTYFYPYYVEYISKSGPDLGDFEDSGLMLFSKFLDREIPFANKAYKASDFKPFWQEGHLAFKEFSDCAFAFEDCRAAKGAALVQLELATDKRFNLVFTHTQADSGDSTHADVREKQMDDVKDVVQTTLGIKFSKWPSKEWLAVIGDLNIDGFGAVNQGILAGGEILSVPPVLPPDPLLANSPPKVTQEWADRFKVEPGQHRTPLYDSWAETTSPFDKGPTTESDKRIDYVLGSEGTGVGDMCVQHVWNPQVLEGLSDHRPVAADINRLYDYCNPRLAKLVKEAELGQITSGLKQTYWQISELKYPGSMQWFRIEQGGTFAFAISGFNPGDAPNVRFQLYSKDNLSVPIGGDYKLEKTNIVACGPQVKTAKKIVLSGKECAFVEGQKFVIPAGPFFIRVFNRRRDWAGQYEFAVYRFSCTSQDDACDLLPNSPQTFSFPEQKPLNADDTAWFRVQIRHQADSGKPQSLQFFSDYQLGQPGTAKLDFVEQDGTAASVGGKQISGPIIENNLATYHAETNQNQTIYMRVKRPVLGLAGYGFLTGWRTNLTLFGGTKVGPGVPTLVCVDETNGTGGNEWGEDEISFKVNVDGQGWMSVPLGYANFDCNDTEDRKVWDGYLGVIGFLDDIKLKLTEVDDSSGDNDSPTVTLHAWPRGQDNDQIPDNWKTADNKTKIWWKFEGGEYQFRRFNMNRWVQ